MRPSLAIAANGSVIVAWEGPSASGEAIPSEIHVARCTFNEWEDIGEGSAWGAGISNTPGRSFNPILAIDPQGGITVAWQDEGPPPITGADGRPRDVVYLRRWNGQVWEELSGSASERGVSQMEYAGNPVIALDRHGNPLVACTGRTDAFSGAFVRRWNGAIWEEIGEGSGSGDGLSDGTPASLLGLVVDSENRPVITWQNCYSPAVSIEARRFNGTVWSQLGLGEINDGDVEMIFPSLTLSPTGEPLCVWGAKGPVPGEQFAAGVRSAHWDGDAWRPFQSFTTDRVVPRAVMATNAGGQWIAAWTQDILEYRTYTLRVMQGP